MSTAARTIFKNASVLMVSQVMTWGLGLLLTIFLPRYLGPSAVGKFHLALSIWAMLGLFVSFGMDMLLTKEIARHPEKTGVYFGSTVGLRAIFFALALVVLTFYLSFVDYPPDTILVLYIIGVTTFVGQLTGACQAVLQGLEKMEYISVGTVANKVFVTVVIIALLLQGYGVVVAAAVGILGALINLVVLLIPLWKLNALGFDFRWDKARWLLKAGTPYLLSTVFLVVYIQMDVVVLSLLTDEQTVGWYSAADHLFGTFLFIPGILMQAVFPALSRSHSDATASSSQFVSRSFRWLLLIGVPIGIGLAVISQPLVLLLYGTDFLQSGAVLAVDGIALIFMYLTILMGWSLVAMDRQKVWVAVMAVATLATVPLDVVLIPWFQNSFGNGAIGGAAAYVVTEAGMVIAGLMLIPKGTFRRSDATFALRIAAAGLLMGAAVWGLRDVFIAVPIATGVVVYLSLVILLRALPEEEIAMMRGLTQSALRRVRVATAEVKS